jgi:hypothetical protein
MAKLDARFKTFKQRGEWVELIFMMRSAHEGMQVSKPYGDSAAYDFIVEYKTRCHRIQVKSTSHQSDGGHCCQVRGGRKQAYLSDAFDFAAIYIIHHQCWFIVPRAQIGNQISLHFSPGVRNSKYGQYEEAWHLLKQPSSGNAPACDG